MMEMEAPVHVYLAPGATDMRKSIDGLCAIVSAVFELDPFSSAWFLFCGKRKERWLRCFGQFPIGIKCNPAWFWRNPLALRP